MIDFGEFRSLVHLQPSKARFDRICWLLEQQLQEDPDDPQLLGRTLPYLEHHLDSWSLALRRAPQKWLAFLPVEYPLLQITRCLRLDRHLPSPPHLRSLHSSPNAARLLRLELRKYHLGQRQDLIELIARWPVPLRELSLLDCNIPERLLHRLLHAVNLQQLERLELIGCRLSDGHFETLLRTDHNLPALRQLVLRKNNISRKSLRLLLDAQLLENLELLDLSNNALGSRGLRALTGADFPSLTSLSLQTCSLQGESTADIPEAIYFPQLEHLELADNALEHLFYALADWGELPTQLAHLGLGEHQLSSTEALDTLLESPLAAKLTSLDLSARLQRSGRKHWDDPLSDFLRARLGASFAKLEAPMQLETLQLAHNQLGDDGLRALLESQALPALRVLDLQDNNIHDRQLVRQLLNSEHLPALAELLLHQNHLPGDLEAIIEDSPRPVHVELA